MKRKITALLLLLTIIVGLFGCGKDKPDESEKPDKITLKGIVSLEEIDIGIERADSISFDNGEIIFSGNNNGKYQVSRMKPGGEPEVTDFAIDEKYGYINDFCSLGEDSIFLSDAFNFETGERLVYIICMSGDELKWVKEKNEIYKSEIPFASVDIISDGKTLCVVIEQFAVLLDADGNALSNYEFPGWVTGSFLSSSGIHFWGMDFHVIVKDSAFVNSPDWLETFRTVQGSQDIGYGGKYDFLHNDGVDLYGCMADGTKTLLVNWMNSDIDVNSIRTFACTDEGELIINIHSMEDVKPAVYHCIRQPDREYDTASVVRVLYREDGSGMVITAASAFNKAYPQYRAALERYSDEGTIQEQLNLILAAGNPPDVIMLDNLVDYNSLINKGVFLDLYECGAVEPEDVFNCIKTRFGTGDKLYVIPTRFDMRTFSAKKGRFPTGEDWTFSAYAKAYDEALKEGKYLAYPTYGRENALNYFIEPMMNRYIDYDANTCSFDCAEFKADMEWLKRLPEEDEYHVTEAQNPYVSDEVLLFSAAVNAFEEYIRAKAVFGGPDEGEIIGFPGSNGASLYLTGTHVFAISAECSNKEAAAAMLKSIINPESIYMRGRLELSPLKSVALSDFEKQDKYLKFNINRPNSWSGSSSETFADELQPGDFVIEADEKLYDEYLAFIDSAQIERRMPEKIKEIIKEELSDFFGGKPADNIAKNIQSRVSLYFSEKE
ncbi:MAG: extracellular solute-binding protein [Eubacteriales bacterium]|jgi:ABC-type glycerol-3-phosphate transport system substrate-binding protein